VPASSSVFLLHLFLTALYVLLLQAVRAIGRCAVSLEKAAQRCISVLLELIQTKVNYVVQEAVIVIKVRPVRRLQDRGYSECCWIVVEHWMLRNSE
jgi:vesicle coat complex subunit